MKITPLWILLGVGSLLLAACASTNTPTPASTTAGPTTASLAISSPAFGAGQAIPVQYTCDGSNTSPALTWGEPPAGTQFFALVLTDPDTPSGGFVHWVIYNIPGTSRGLPEAISTDPQLADGTVQGINGGRQLGYTGPCPPSGVHHYVFELYALDASLSLEAGATKEGLLSAAQDHILAQAELTGTYGK